MAEEVAAKKSDRISLTCSAEYPSYPLTAQSCWALASFKPPPYEPTSRSPVDIVAVIDKSGSMRGEKIELVKKTLLFVIDQLKECDRMSLVTYDSRVDLVFELTVMDKTNKDRAKSFIQSLRDGSCTNLCGGLLKGMEQIALTSGGKKAQVQSVLLLTDGLANEGITGKDRILDQVKKFQELGLGAVQMPTVYSSSPPQAPSPRRRGRGIFAGLFGRNAPVPLPRSQRLLPRVQMQQNRAPIPLPVEPQQQLQGDPQELLPPHAPPQQQQMPPPPQPNIQAAPPQPQQQQMPPPPNIQAALASPSSAQQQGIPPPPPPLPPRIPVQQQVFAPPLQVDDPIDSPTPIPSGPKFDGTIYTFGFGSDHNANLLEAISTQGGGVYYYIDTNEKIPESFADCLGGLLSVVGQNLSLKLEMQGQNTMDAVHANRTINWTTLNMSCEIPMGDLQSEEERDIVLELKLPAVPAPVQDLVLKTSLSYFNIITSTLDTVTYDLFIERKDGEQGIPSEPVDVQRNRILATSALKKAEALADQGKLDEAKAFLKETIQTLECSITAQYGFCKALISDLRKSMESMQTRQSYLGHGKLYMCSKVQSHSVQRSNFVDDTSYYQSASKMSMRSKAKSAK